MGPGVIKMMTEATQNHAPDLLRSPRIDVPGKTRTPLAVVCFYWLGDRWNNDGLGPRYINALYYGVEKHLSSVHNFICFTNERMIGLNKGIEVRPFFSPSPRGVLPRMYMFSKESGLFDHQVLALDLDIIIVGDLQNLADYRGVFCSRSKFQPGQEYKLDGDVTSFQACEEAEKLFWTPLVNLPRAVEELTGGRERYWFRHVLGGERNGDRWDKITPGQVVSYKRHVKSNNNLVPHNARIVSCHGTPRPHQISKLPWVRSNWNG
jgi:hypothetical protein